MINQNQQHYSAVGNARLPNNDQVLPLIVRASNTVGASSDVCAKLDRLGNACFGDPLPPSDEAKDRPIHSLGDSLAETMENLNRANAYLDKLLLQIA